MPQPNNSNHYDSHSIPSDAHQENLVPANNALNLPHVVITIMPGQTFQAQFIQAGITVVHNNGNMITFNAPMHNLNITANHDGLLNLTPIGENLQLFEEE